jgi:hypothetical protein
MTARGKKVMRNLLPNHSKLVKSLMRVRHAKKQDSLFRICRKLREVDVSSLSTRSRIAKTAATRLQVKVRDDEIVLQSPGKAVRLAFGFWIWPQEPLAVEVNQV